MRICVYEDRHVSGLEPLALTRPVTDLLCGLTSLGDKQSQFFAATAIGYLCRPLIADLLRARDPLTRVNDAPWLRAAPTVLVNARWLPPQSARTPGQNASRRTYGFGSTPVSLDKPCVGMVDGQVAFVVLDTSLLSAVSPATLDDCLADWAQALPTREVGGKIITRPWELVERNAEQMNRDFGSIADQGVAGFHPTGFALVGPTDRLVIHSSARIDPMVVADTTHGPVVIGAGAVIHAFTRLEEPCSIGDGTVLLGATIRAGTTLGPGCRIGGEVEASIVHGHTNKYHEGFLGHSYVGEWVNLAAGTNTSDLRCDYHPVSATIDGQTVPTGQTKVGAIIGDHAKTGLGVLLDCGTVIGPFAQVLPCGQFAPRWIPGYSRVGPSGVKELTDVNRLLETAELVMRRRGKQLAPELEAVYRSLAAQRSPAPEVLPLRKTA
jgi:UDP-N-acetylglucosamine diphosphorylase/glucosamine-1-phosphate N-acetyltransferase